MSAMPLSGEGNAVCELRDMAVYISQISEKKNPSWQCVNGFQKERERDR